MKNIELRIANSFVEHRIVVQAVDGLLNQKNAFSPLEVFVELGLLPRQNYLKWRCGDILFFENALTCSKEHMLDVLDVIENVTSLKSLYKKRVHYKKQGLTANRASGRLIFFQQSDKIIENRLLTRYSRQPHRAKKNQQFTRSIYYSIDRIAIKGPEPIKGHVFRNCRKYRLDIDQIISSVEKKIFSGPELKTSAQGLSQSSGLARLCAADQKMVSADRLGPQSRDHLKKSWHQNNLWPALSTIWQYGCKNLEDVLSPTMSRILLYKIF